MFVLAAIGVDMTQGELWQLKYQKIVYFIETHHRVNIPFLNKVVKKIMKIVADNS